ncbi:MAG: ASKHA domain-containing protein [Pseudomonadota bacterium]
MSTDDPSGPGQASDLSLDRPEVIFQPMGLRVAARPEATILELARRAGLPLEAACGGKGLCGKCKVRLPGQPPPPDPAQARLLGAEADQGLRLACQTSLPQGGAVWVPPESLQRRQVILTAGAATDLELDPAVLGLEVRVPPASLAQPRAAAQRLAQELRTPQLEMPLEVLRELPRTLASRDGLVTVALWQDRRVLEVLPGHGLGHAQPRLGLAVDLGTTTVVAYLLDLADGRPLAVEAAMNPQVMHGDDVISRISHACQDPAHRAELAGLAVACLNQLARQACQSAGVSAGRILECVVVGNTAMHHLFLGLDPSGLAAAPYAPVAGAPLDLPAAQLGLDLAPLANLHLPPVKAGFVGSDAVAAALAAGADRVETPTLILDLGTNGEMILATPGEILCCSTAAGPAFEGGHIKCGMRGAAGAVERVALNPATLEPSLTVIGGGAPLGLCGSGLVSAVAELVRRGVVEPNGGWTAGLEHPRLRPGQEGREFVLAWAAQTGGGQDLVLTAQDLSQMQLAKGAILAGARIMLDRLGLAAPERVLLAGAFGNYLDPADALDIGLLPAVERHQVRGIGNAAGAGSLMALASRQARQRAARLAQRMDYLELAALPGFLDRFLEGMRFPTPGQPGL